MNNATTYRHYICTRISFGNISYCLQITTPNFNVFLYFDVLLLLLHRIGCFICIYTCAKVCVYRIKIFTFKTFFFLRYQCSLWWFLLFAIHLFYFQRRVTHFRSRDKKKMKTQQINQIEGKNRINSKRKITLNMLKHYFIIIQLLLHSSLWGEIE